MKNIIFLLIIVVVQQQTNGLRSHVQIKLKNSKLPPILKYHRCGSLPTEINSNGKLRLDISTPVEGRFNLIRRMTENNKLNYERWVATNKDDGGSYFVKFYYKEDKSGLWQIKDKFSLPQRECDQLMGIQDVINSASIKGVKFEQCLEGDKEGGDSDSPVPYFNVYKTPQGQPLSNLCILKDCRSKIKQIAHFLLNGLLALSMGPTEFNIIENLTPDNIYYFENATEQFVTITDMKVNEFPCIDKTKRPWKEDMELIGKVLTKLLTQKCEYEMEEGSRESALKLYLQVHEDQNYLENDVDMGVPLKIVHSTGDHECATFESKQNMLRPTLYDFITKLSEGKNQFLDPGEALNHPYLIVDTKKKVVIDRPSDV